MSGLVSLGLLALTGAAIVQESPRQISLDEVHDRPTLELAERLLGGAAPEIVAATTIWHQGVAQYSAVSAFFAPRAEPTIWRGLCSLEIRSVYLPFAQRDPEGILEIEAPRRRTYYRLVEPAAPASRAGDSADARTVCATLPNPFAGENWSAIWVGRGNQTANPDEVAFVYRAFDRVRRFRRIDDRQCTVEFYARCRDIRQMLGNLDLRELWDLSLGPCPKRPAFLCVSGHLGATYYGGYVRIEVETDSREVGAPERPVHIRGVRAASQMQPIA